MDCRASVSADLDVSVPARQRKRIRGAAGSLKIIGIFSALFVSAYVSDYSSLAAIICAVLVMLGSFWTAKRLRAGRPFSVGLAAGWLVWWFGFAIYATVKATRAGLNPNSVLGALIFVVTAVFLFRGIYAFRVLRAYQNSMRTTADPLANRPWEEGLSPFN